MTKRETASRNRYWSLYRDQKRLRGQMSDAFEKGWKEGGRVMFHVGNMSAPAAGFIICVDARGYRLFIENERTGTRRWISVTDVCGRGD